MRRRLVAMMAAAICGLLLHGQSAWCQYLDSSLFNHQFNGDTGPNANGYTHVAGPEVTWNPTSDGDLLTYQGSIAEGGYWQSDDWVLGPDASSNGNGWTIEFRIKIGADQPDDGTFGAFQIYAKDGGNVTASRRTGISVGRTFTQKSHSPTSTIDANDNTDDFHVFRIAQPANSNVMTVWRDGVQLFNATSASSNSSSPAEMWWGDGTSASGLPGLNPSVFVDYLRWDKTGYQLPDRLFSFQPGDLDADGDVDIVGDYEILKTNWLQTVTPSIANADLNFDTVVDIFDFAVFKDAYIAANGGSGSELQVPVPEPSALILLAAALPALLFLKRRGAK